MSTFVRNVAKRITVAPTRRALITGVTLMSTVGLLHAHLLPSIKPLLSTSSSALHAESKIRTTLSAEDLKGGNPSLKTLFLVHDSRVPTQVEFVQDVQAKDLYERLSLLGVTLVHLDVARHSVEGLAD